MSTQCRQIWSYLSSSVLKVCQQIICLGRIPHSRTPLNDSPTRMKFLSQNFKYFTMAFCLLTWLLALLYPIQIKCLSLYVSCNHCYRFSLTRKDCVCKISEGCFVYLSEQLVTYWKVPYDTVCFLKSTRCWALHMRTAIIKKYKEINWIYGNSLNMALTKRFLRYTSKVLADWSFFLKAAFH